MIGLAVILLIITMSPVWVSPVSQLLHKAKY